VTFHATLRAAVLSHDAFTPLARGRFRALLGMGCSVSLLLPASATEGETLAYGADGGIRLVPIPVRGDPLAARWADEPIRRFLSEVRPEILQVEAEPWWPVARQALKAAARLHVPAVLHVDASLPPTLSFAERFRRGRALSLARGFAASNRLALGLVAEGEPLPSAVFPRQGLVVPPSLGRPRAPRPGFEIGFVGRLVPERGLDVLLRACAQLRGEWRLTVVGTGPAQEELEQLAEKLGIGARVTWKGGLPRHWLDTFWPTIDCVVLPARTTPKWVESAGQAALDAMAQGLPVIGTESGVLPEIIGEAGITVPEDDPDRLALALQRLQAMPDEQARLGSLGRRRVMAEFADEAVARKTLAFWRWVATGKRDAAAPLPAFDALT
jgi:glycosyltransferase involved in cell wall biosynthesis